MNQSSTSLEIHHLVITNIYSFLKGDGIRMFLFNDNITIWFHILPYNALTSFIWSENGVDHTYFYLQQRAWFLSRSSLSFSFLYVTTSTITLLGITTILRASGLGAHLHVRGTASDTRSGISTWTGFHNFRLKMPSSESFSSSQSNLLP